MENFLTSLRNRVLLLVIFIGLILIGVGIFVFKSQLNFNGTKVEVLSGSDENVPKNITVEISGEVITPGVYKLTGGARVDEVLVAAGGFSEKADRVWTDKYLNRAAKLTDGQKIFIPKSGEQSSTSTAKIGVGDQTVSPSFSTDSKTIININTASLGQLDGLPGIGQVYGQSIIEHRPYSTVDELVSKGAIKQSLYNKIKDSVTIY